MRKVVLYALLSADGIAESPDRYVLAFDDVMRKNLAEVVSRQDAVLLGRGGYDDWAGYWPHQDQWPFAPFINTVPKYVVTSSPLQTSWDPVRVVDRPLAEFVAELKATEGGDIGVHGSLELFRSMLAEGLVDELRLTVAPTLAGTGRRLFPDGARRALELIDADRTPSGALLLAYRLGDPID